MRGTQQSAVLKPFNCVFQVCADKHS